MSVPSYSFYSLLLKLPNKGMSFQFPPLKLPNNGRDEYSKMIIVISFNFIQFPPPKRGLKGSFDKRFLVMLFKYCENKCCIV